MKIVLDAENASLSKIPDASFCEMGNLSDSSLNRATNGGSSRVLQAEFVTQTNLRNPRHWLQPSLVTRKPEPLQTHPPPPAEMRD